MAEINRRTGRPVTFGIAQSNAGPDLSKVILDLVDEEAAAGGELRPQTTARGIGLLFGLQHRTFFDRTPLWQALSAAALRGTRSRALDDDTRRDELIAEAEQHLPPLDWSVVLRAHSRSRRLLRRSRATRSRRLAAAAGESIPAAFVRITRETEGMALFSFPFLNQRMDAVEEMLEHPRMLVGLGDSGAHVGQIMDASLPTLVPRLLGARPQEAHDRRGRASDDVRHCGGVRRAEPGCARARRLRRRERARPRRAHARLAGVRPRLPGAVPVASSNERRATARRS